MLRPPARGGTNVHCECLGRTGGCTLQFNSWLLDQAAIPFQEIPINRSLWIFFVVAWLVAATTAFFYRDVLAASDFGNLVLIVLGFPPAFALYMLAEALGEGVVYLLVLAAFKVVTLGLVRTALTSQTLDFPWYGFARDGDGRLVASEACVYTIGFTAYATAGLGCYFW